MRDVRKRSERTDAMFDPLKDAATLLTSVGVTLGDGVLKQLEGAEFKWKGLKKKMLNRREQLAALQQAEAVEIRRQSDAFAERVEDYRRCKESSMLFCIPQCVCTPTQLPCLRCNLAALSCIAPSFPQPLLPVFCLPSALLLHPRYNTHALPCWIPTAMHKRRWTAKLNVPTLLSTCHKRHYLHHRCHHGIPAAPLCAADSL